MITWRAVYGEEDFLRQYNEDGSENKYQDIDRWRLKRFDLLKDDHPICSVYLRQGQRLIYRRRTFVNLNNDRTVVYLVGWQKTIETDKGLKNVTSIMYVHPDGSIALDGSRQNLELLPEEL